MVVVTSALNRTGAASPSPAVSRSLLTVQLEHACRATTCSDATCTLCSNSTLRACSSELKQKYVAGSGLQAPCGAWPVVRLLSSQPELLNTAACQLKISLIDDVKYQKLCLAGAPPAGDRLASCLADDAGLKCEGAESTEVVLPVEAGKADLTDLHIYKVPGGRSGHSTYYRLLFTTLLDFEARDADNNSTQPRSAGPSASPTAAPFLTDKLQLITTRSKCNEKCDVLHASQPVRRVQAVGEGFAKILADLSAAVPGVPAELASVTKVGDFHRLVKWVKQTANTSVPNLFRPNDWARSSQHVLSALLEDDTRQRLWFPSVSGAGLLFQCQQGSVMLDAPASFVLMMAGRLVLRPLSQLAPVQQQQLLQKAKEDWQAAGHPNWAIYERDKKPEVPERATGVAAAGVGSSAVASKPEVVLAKAAIAAAFGAVAGMAGASQKPAQRRKLAITGCSNITSMVGNSSNDSSRASQSPSPQMSSAAASGAPAVVTPGSVSSTSQVDDIPVLDLAGTQSVADIQPLAQPATATAAAVASDNAPVAAEAAAVAAATGAVVSSKRGQQRDEQESPAKKRLRLRLVSRRKQAGSGEGKETAAEPAAEQVATEPAAEQVAAAADPPVAGEGVRVEAAVAEGRGNSPEQQSIEPQELMDSEDAVVGNILEQLMYDGTSDDWSSELESDMVAGLEVDPYSTVLQDMQQQLQEAERQQEAEVLKLLYKSMSDDWCSELDADLSNNLGSGFLIELQQLQEDAAAAKQQQAAGCKVDGAAAELVKQASLSRLISLSELPDFSDLCDAMCLQSLSHSVEQLPIVLV